MQSAAVWGPVTRIAQDVSMMPVDVGRKTINGWVDIESTAGEELERACA